MQIVVATPGRMLDIIGRKAVDFTEVYATLLLDEADEMLNMGFQEDINEYSYPQLPTRKKPGYSRPLCLPEVSRIAKKYMTDPA